MSKRGKLKDMKIHEVSLVDLPANKLPFLFFKRDGAKESCFVKAKKKIKIEIESDGTVGGTSIAINGEKLDSLRNFDFSFYGTDPKQAIHASYSKETGTEDGFSRTETYYLSKGEIMKEKTLKSLEKYLGTEDIDFEKKVSEEDIEKALTLITEHYKESFPDDLENAVGVIAKCAINKYEGDDNGDNKDVKKAGAKFSKDAIKKLKAILEAVESLKSILPNAEQSTEKSASNDDALSKLSKQIEDLNSVVAKLNPEKTEKKVDLEELTKSLKDISERVKSMEKDGAVKKSITGDDTDNDEPKGAGENGTVLWKSLQPGTKTD